MGGRGKTAVKIDGGKTESERGWHKIMLQAKCVFIIFPLGAHQGQERKQLCCYFRAVLLQRNDY